MIQLLKMTIVSKLSRYVIGYTIVRQYFVKARNLFPRDLNWVKA